MLGKTKYAWTFILLCLLLSVIGGFPLSQSNADDQNHQQISDRQARESALSMLQKEDNPEWKVQWNEEGGVVKRLYNAKSRVFPGKPQDAAREFLSTYHVLFGVNQDLANLQMQKSAKTPLGERVIFKQYYNQIPVIGAEITVHVSDNNNIFLVENRCIPNIQIDTEPSVENDDAVSTAEEALSVDKSHVEKASSELVVFPNGPVQNLAWRVIISKKGLINKTWLVYIDAKRPGWVLYKKLLQAFAGGNGQGSVYKENPATTPSLTSVTLKNLSTGPLLRGKFGRPYNAKCNRTVTDTSNLSGLSTASSANRKYLYKKTDNRLEEVMAYYHANVEHDTLKSLFGFKVLDVQIPIFVNVLDPNNTSVGFDNAFYTRDPNFPKTGFLLFGCGNIFPNFALDGNVINHEYGHAVLDHIEPKLLETYEHNYPGAIHEHTGDVMASYFGGNAIIAEYAGVSKDKKQSFTRNMDNTRKYPNDVYEPSLHTSEVHYTGEILNGVYWNIRKVLGADKAFKLFFSAINLIPGDATFFDMRDAWITADNNLFSGKDKNAINTAFTNHGIKGNDPGNNLSTLALSAMSFYKYNPNTGKLTKQTTFNEGDYILVSLKAKVSKLTPAYNLIPTDFSLAGNGANTFRGQLYLNEALNGTYEYFIAMITSNGASGKIDIKAKARLGGTNKVKSLAGSFTMKK